LTYLQWVAFEPEGAGRNGRIDTDIFPPCCFIAAAMDLTMVAAAKGNGELIADPAAKCLALHKSELMGICRPSAANQAGMLGDRSDVIRSRTRHGSGTASALLSIARERQRCFGFAAVSFAS
jgi:hypothetical protein